MSDLKSDTADENKNNCTTAADNIQDGTRTADDSGANEKLKGDSADENNNNCMATTDKAQDSKCADGSGAKEKLKGEKDDQEGDDNEQNDEDSYKNSLPYAPVSMQGEAFRSDPQKLDMLVQRLECMDARELAKFMMDPLPPGVWFECDVRRTSTGMTRFNRTFELYFKRKEHEHMDFPGIHLASCYKQSCATGSHYVVSASTNPTDMEEGDLFVGKIRSNFTGSEFTAYGPGYNPKKLNQVVGTDGPLSEEVREEMAYIGYDSSLSLNPIKLFEPSQTRKVKVVLPAVFNDDGCVSRTPCKALSPAVDGLLALTTHHSQCSESGGKPLVRTYVNKPGKWNSQVKCYVLNFHNRAPMRSVKNFQLVEEDNHNEIILQFGRFEKQNFHLDFRYPMSPFQALSLAVSSMDYKICTQ